ncbi:helix-turn-helix domain-containing protein [Mesorhizobium sp. M0317]|uniref:helix-turn-helix domain-containing protein n=1 Tax=Mesorhizobium sp. M0317 TaxID=2956935 RepID=UPI00333DF843
MTPPNTRARPRASAHETSKPINRTGKGWFPVGNAGGQSTYRLEAATLAEQGATLSEIAAELGCSDRTLSRWRLQYAEFREALDLGRKRRAVVQADAVLAREIEAQRPVHEAALALEEMLKELVAPTTAVDDPAEPARGRQPLSGTREPPDPASRLAERRAERRQPVDAWQGDAYQGGEPGDGEPVELDDPRADW